MHEKMCGYVTSWDENGLASRDHFSFNQTATICKLNIPPTHRGNDTYEVKAVDYNIWKYVICRRDSINDFGAIGNVSAAYQFTSATSLS